MSTEVTNVVSRETGTFRIEKIYTAIENHHSSHITIYKQILFNADDVRLTKSHE